MIEIEIPKVFKPIKDNYRYKILWGGRGSGKSESIARYLLIEGAREPMNILCCREFQSSIRESVKSLLDDLIKKYNLQSFYRSTLTEIIGDNGTKFIFAGLRHNISNIKSMHNIKKCWCEESQTLSATSLKVLFPTIRAKDSEIIFSLNPNFEDEPAYQMLIEDPPSDSLVLKVNYDQNKYFPDVLRKDMEEMREKNYQEYLHIWEGHPRTAVEGAIFQEQLQKAKDEGRIGSFPYDDRYPVSAFLDIGWRDHTSIWFLQIINHELRVIDFYENNFKKTPHYIEVMEQKKYRYDRICLPHDANNEHANAERTWLQLYMQSFPNAYVYAGKRQQIETRLEATKNMFDLLKINKDKCADGISHLSRYHYAIDENTGKSTREPFHGPESDASDSFAYMCLELEQPIEYDNYVPQISSTRLG